MVYIRKVKCLLNISLTIKFDDKGCFEIIKFVHHFNLLRIYIFNLD
jgi:hypothetical protein